MSLDPTASRSCATDGQPPLSSIDGSRRTPSEAGARTPRADTNATISRCTGGSDMSTMVAEAWAA